MSAHQTRSFSTSMRPMIRCTASRKGGFFTGITTATVICRSIFSAGGICWLQSFDRRGWMEVHAVRFTPGHQFLTGKAAVGAQQNPHMRPALTNLFHDPRHLLDCAICCIQPRRSKLCSQQMPPAENIERQITVAVVIPVKKPPFLLAVHRIIGRIEVENDLVWWALMRI